jgi:hypothetical protein
VALFLDKFGRQKFVDPPFDGKARVVALIDRAGESDDS